MLVDYIETLIHKLGEGFIDPVSYDTAWVAQVPSLHEPYKPAFPEALIWLRQHQLRDGSWGTDGIIHIGANIVSTLAAIKAFSTWKFPADDARIKHGLIALKQLILRIGNDTHQTIRLPLLLTMFANDLNELPLPDKFIQLCKQRYSGFGDLEKQFFDIYKKKLQTQMPDAWWFSLEILGSQTRHKEVLKVQQHLFSDNGSVFVSPSATAHALSVMRKEQHDFPAAFHYLEQQIHTHQGGVAHLSPIDEFELAFGVDYLLKAGMSATSAILKPAIEKLYSQYSKRNGIAASKYLPLLDVDDTAVAINIFCLAGYSVTADGLLAYFNGNTVACYLGHLSTTLSINLSALQALSLFRGNQRIDDAISSIVVWIVQKMQSGQMHEVLSDQWHLSPYYNAVKVIFALYDYDHFLVTHCIRWILDHQREDGGWGWYKRSTLEETAYASLALNYACQKKYDIPLSVLCRAQAFLSRSESNAEPRDAFWIGKVLYHPKWVVEAAILGARYALKNTLT